MEQSIELMIGLFFLILGLSYLIRASDWVIWLDGLRQNARNTSLTLGLINLLFGALVISFHWKWEGIASLVTVLGCIALFKGFVYLICPGWLPKKLDWIGPNPKTLIRISGLVAAAIGATLLYDWCTVNGYMQAIGTVQ